MGSPWPQFHMDALRDFVRIGDSFSQIRNQMNDKFGTSYTRNSVIGKAKRMGIQDTKPTVARIETVRKPKPPLAPKAKSPEFAPLRCVEVTPRNIGLLDLEPGDCRWPDGDGPFTFCGNPRVADNVSYCRTHLALSVGVRT